MKEELVDQVVVDQLKRSERSPLFSYPGYFRADEDCLVL